MARKKFRNTSRHAPNSERSFQEYILNQSVPRTTRSELIRLIRGGEDTYLELKIKLSNPDKIAQEIVALANTAGGTMVFGVSDQLRIEGLRNPEGVQDEIIKICREDIYPAIVPLMDMISFDDGRRVISLDIQGKNRPYRTTDGKFYLRIGDEKREATREELSALIDETRPLFYENIPLADLTERDFDDSLLWSFIEAFEKDDFGRNGYETENVLKKDLLLAIGGRNEFLPTVAGVLLFGKNERIAEIMPRASVTLLRYAGDDKKSELVEREVVSGNLLTLYEEIVKFIERYCDLWKHKARRSKTKENAPVSSRGNYHLYSIKEACANLLMHRDLALRDIATKVVIFDKSIEFSNPRRTSGFIPPASKAIRYGITQRVNPQIAAIFSRREYGINHPRGGLPMILKQTQHFAGKKAQLYTSGDRFKLKIHSS